MQLMKDEQNNSKKAVVKRSMKDAMAGAAAGALSKTIIAPVERIKLVMQLRFSIENTTSKGSGKIPTTAWGVATTIYKDEGFFAFWRGMIVLIGCERLIHFHFCNIIHRLILFSVFDLKKNKEQLCYLPTYLHTLPIMKTR